MDKILMSGCLLGKKVRYNGKSLTVTDSIVDTWVSEGRVVSVCPEVESGMSIPRIPAEIKNGNGFDVLENNAEVHDQEGNDVTEKFISGASIALELCQRFDIKVAILAEHSPSCGSSSIYDGHFAGKKISGIGVTAALLTKHGIKVFNQYEIDEASRVIETFECDDSYHQ